MELKRNIPACSSSYVYDNVIIMNKKETKFFDDYNEDELKDIFNATESFDRFHIRYITDITASYNRYKMPRECLAIYFDSDHFEFKQFQVAVKLMSA